MKHYDETKVLSSLSRKGCAISSHDKTISVPYNSTNLGNGSWGKIDFLTHYKGWTLLRTTAKSSKKVNSYDEDDYPKFKKNKVEKHM